MSLMCTNRTLICYPLTCKESTSFIGILMNLTTLIRYCELPLSLILGFSSTHRRRVGVRPFPSHGNFFIYLFSIFLLVLLLDVGPYMSTSRIATYLCTSHLTPALLFSTKLLGNRFSFVSSRQLFWLIPASSSIIILTGFCLSLAYCVYIWCGSRSGSDSLL